MNKMNIKRTPSGKRITTIGDVTSLNTGLSNQEILRRLNRDQKNWKKQKRTRQGYAVNDREMLNSLNDPR